MVDFCVTIKWNHRRLQCRRSLGLTRNTVKYVEVTMIRWRKICPMQNLALCFLSANDNATRQNDVASLARTCLRDCRAKAEDSRKLSREDRGEERRENLDASVSERPHQGLWAIFAAANAWRILEGGRETQIDDPCARFEKTGGTGRERRGGIQVEKKRRGRTYRFLPFAHTDTSVCVDTVCRWARSCAWVSTEDGAKRASRSDV